MERHEVSLGDYINAVEDFEDELENLNRLVDNLNEVSNQRSEGNGPQQGLS